MSLQHARLAGLLVLAASQAWGQAQPATPPKLEPVTEAPSTNGDQRTQLNLARQTDASSGESQRNENNRVNPVDTNTERELTRRIGATATVVRELETKDTCCCAVNFLARRMNFAICAR